MAEQGLWDALVQAWPASKAKGLWEGLDYSGVGAAMPESYGANSPIMDPLAKAALGLGKSAISGVMAPGDAWAGKLDPMSDEGFRRTMDLAGLMTLGAGAAPAEANSFRAGIKAYHGSPHDFDKFDLSKIGTGEGAQAYGHGLYFAENPKVAEAYKNDPKMMSFARGKDWTGDQEEAFGWLHENGYDTKAASDAIAKRIGQARMYGDSPESTASLNQIKDIIDSGWQPPRGKMYEVNINADPEHFLDWEGKLGQQPQAVQDAFAKQLAQFGPDSRMDAQLKIAGSRHPQGLQGVTQDLAQAGIPGIKYLDQGSRGAGEGSRNYVVFDDKLVDIMKKYGLVGATPLATGLGLARRDNNQ